MNILIIGSGGREHSLTKLFHSNCKNILFGYGPNLNYGINSICKEFVVGSLSDFNKINHNINLWKIELVVIGPEKPITEGLVDYLISKNTKLYCFGPTKNNSKIESSKIFARQLMKNNNLDCYSPNYTILEPSQFNKTNIYENIFKKYNKLFVIKPDGLTSGKGVKLYGEHLNTYDEANQYINQALNEKSNILIEEQLKGDEFSIFTITDGYNCIHSPAFQDFKRLHGNSGPMTGGMGCKSFGDKLPPFLESFDDIETAKLINEKIIKSLFIYNYNYNKGNIEPYKGVLYGSFMKVKNKKKTDDNPNNIYVIEFNCRFGDPEIINLCHLINKKRTNINMIFKHASCHNKNIIYNDVIQNTTYSNNELYTDYFNFNSKYYKLSKYNWVFMRELSLSKYLVDKSYQNNLEITTIHKTKNVILDIIKESYWLLHENIICGNVSIDTRKSEIECGKSRCFSLVLSYNKKIENMIEIEIQANLFLNQISQNRFYYVENIV